MKNIIKNSAFVLAIALTASQIRSEVNYFGNKSMLFGDSGTEVFNPQYPRFGLTRWQSFVLAAKSAKSYVADNLTKASVKSTQALELAGNKLTGTKNAIVNTISSAGTRLSSEAAKAQGLLTQKREQASNALTDLHNRYSPTPRAFVATNSEADQIATGFANEFAQVSFVPQFLQNAYGKVTTALGTAKNATLEGAGYAQRACQLAHGYVQLAHELYPKTTKAVEATLAAGALYVIAKKAYNEYQGLYPQTKATTVKWVKTDNSDSQPYRKVVA